MLLAPATQSAPPQCQQTLSEYREAVEVSWYRIVVEVALHDRLEPSPRLSHGIMHAPLATDGNFYGTAAAGGANNSGTIFSVSPTGSFTKLYDFQISTGYDPQVTLLQHTNGLLYGQTFCGGTRHGGQCSSGGVFYSLNAGLAALVAFVPAQQSGKVGASVGILGQGLLGTTSVTFDGPPATFTVSSDTFLTATVPSAVLTGPVTVNTSSGPLKSNVSFRVIPNIIKFRPTSGPVGTPVTITGVSLTQTPP